MSEITLTRPQQCAIETLGKDICVVAGPGAGKTMVLVQRFLRLVASGISPLGILAITFTEKAATQLKQRLIEQFGGQPALRPQIERAYVSTVHGFCARLLRENAIAAGVDPEFRVLDEREAPLIEREAVTGALDAMLAEKPAEMRSLLAHLASPDLGAAITAVYATMRAAGIRVAELEEFPPVAGTPFSALLDAVEDLLVNPIAARTPKQRSAAAEMREWCERVLELRAAPVSERHFALLGGFKLNRLPDPRLKTIKDELIPGVTGTLITEFYAPDRRTLIEALARFDVLYRQRKAALGALDYSDLEEFAVALLSENASVRQSVRSQFEQVLMDELQDTNRQQARLVNLVRAPDRFYAVGDINQSIYGFRDADPGVFRNYRDQVRAAGRPVIELRKNFRSRPEILTAALAILAGAEGIEPHRLTAGKSFTAKTEPSVEILVARAASAEEALSLEARLVACRIRELEGSLTVHGRPAEFGDFAVLVRNSNILEAFIEAFHAGGIPCQVDRGRGFYAAREVRDLLAMLRVLANPRDEVATATVLRSPLVGVSDDTLLGLKQNGNLGSVLGRLEQIDLAGLDGGDRERLLRFSSDLARWRQERNLAPADRLLIRAMDRAGYESGLDPRQRANVDKLLAMLRRSAERNPLDAVVAEFEILRSAASGEAGAAVEDSGHAVQIMTVHAAKGLEFPIVFLAGLSKGVDNNLGPIGFSPEIGLGAQWRDPAGNGPRPDLVYARVRDERRRKEAGESERLFYVAMTRAEEHLVLSFAGAGNRRAEWAEYLARGLPVDLDRVTNQARTERIEIPGEEPFDLRVLIADRPPESLPAAAASSPQTPAGERIRAAVSGQYDSTASVTSISQFSSCPRRYYLARYLGWSGGKPARIPEEHDYHPPETDELDASEFGRQVHAILAGTHTGPAAPEALELARRFQESELGRRAARATRVEREFDFLMAVEDVVLHGQIDLWFEEGGRLVVVDYKTDAVDAAAAGAHAEEYALQLQLYAMAVQQLSGHAPDQAFVYLLRPEVAAPVPVQPLFLHAAAGAVRQFREAQEQLAFPLKPGPRCLRCPFYRGLCPSDFKISPDAL